MTAETPALSEGDEGLAEVDVAIKAQNPDLATAWRTIAWWHQTCAYWNEQAEQARADRDSLATLVSGQAARLSGQDAALAAVEALDIYAEVKAERERAHAKHGDTSMEAQPADAPLRGFILMEEVGEVAKEFNEARHRGGGLDMAALRKELVQVAAMATAWADAIPTAALATTPTDGEATT